ncbi:histidine kinase [Nonomuraea angiospora]|uniref:sensor histidine kinase n=1 Tax=Nonomuraea angiospora TaxID=46172 RepID=UPI0033EC9187
MSPRDRQAKAGAAAGAALTLGLTAAGIVLHLADGRTPGNPDLMAWWPMSATAACSYGLMGAWLAGARPRLVIGWLLLAIGLLQTISFAGPQYAVHALAVGHPLPGAEAALWVGNWTWRTGFALIALVLPLLLPDGRLLGRGWRPAMWLAAAGVLAASVDAARTGYTVDAPSLIGTYLRNPVGVDLLPQWLELAVNAVPAAALAFALVCLWLRWSGGGLAQRQQLKWIGLGFAATVVLFGLGFPLGPVVTAAAMLPLPLGCLVAAMRYGLWDVDVVVSRSLRYTLLLLCALVGYTALVDVLSGLLGRSTGAPLVAVAVVALAGRPLEGLLRGRVNRLVHGQSEDPYAVLAGIARRLDAARDADVVGAELLPEMTRTVASTMRLPYVAIELADGERVAHGSPVAETERLPLRYGGADVGTMLVGHRADGLSRAERRLLASLAASAGVAVHTVALTRDLVRSRQQLVTAREEERRRLYRELHDGFGPLLAAAALQAETARDLIGEDRAAATRLLDKVVPRLRGAVDDVRGIVHGLRPPALDDLGLPSAVRELAGRFAGARLRVDVDIAEPLEQAPAAVEVAAYRMVAEALTNTTRHAGAATARVELRREADDLRVVVEDDGRGMPPSLVPGMGVASMRARARELGGDLTIGAGTGGAGTRVEARLPLRTHGEIELTEEVPA